MAFFKTVFNDAMRRGITTNNPFNLLDFPQVTTRKPRLSVEQLTDLEKLELPEREGRARNTFLLQFYLYGSRISDVLLLKPQNWRKDPHYRQYLIEREQAQKMAEDAEDIPFEDLPESVQTTES